MCGCWIFAVLLLVQWNSLDGGGRVVTEEVVGRTAARRKEFNPVWADPPEVFEMHMPMVRYRYYHK